MKVFITHDANGTITSMGAPPDRFAATAGNTPMDAQTLCVLEVPEIEHSHHFHKYLQEFRIELRSEGPTLVKK